MFSISCISRPDTKKIPNALGLGNELFAIIDNENIIIIKDTVVFKKEIRDIIFSKKSNVKYDKIDIIKQYSIGKSKEDLYYVILYDFEKNLKTARVLEKNDNNLIFAEEKDFEKMFISCVGKEDDCVPRIVSIDSKKSWICSDSDEIKECSIDGEGCKIYRTIYLKDN